MAASTTSVSLPDDPNLQALLMGNRWVSPALTYGFPTAASSWTGYASGSEPFTDFRALTAEQQGAVATALATWSRVANVTFTPVTEPQQTADIRYAGTGRTNTSHAYYPHTSPAGGDVWLGARMTGAARWQPGTYEFLTLVHETGHALGLKHPHDTAFSGFPAGAERDSLVHTVMSYRSYPDAPLNGSYVVERGSYPAAPMLDDIAAVQDLYGANYATNAGDTVYRFAPGQGIIFQTVWDGGGTDTYDASAYAAGVAIDLRPGAWSTFDAGQLGHLDLANPQHRAPGNIANAYLHDGDPRALIENAVGGSGNDTLTGNAAANRLDGGAGNDRLNGLGGNDTIIGGTGDDLAVLGDAGGTALVAGVETLVGGAGADWVQLADGGNAVVLSGLETLIGGAGEDRVVLGDAGNTLILAAIETLVGGAGPDFVMLGNRGGTMDVSGVEVLVGGAARDEITVTAGAIQFDGRGGADRVVLNAGGGIDRILFDVPAGDGFDEVAGFQGGLDQVFALATLHLRVDRNADAALSAATRNGGTVDLRMDELVRLTNPVGVLNDADYASFRAALGGVATGGAAASALVLASDGYNDGLYLLADNGDGVVAAGEVRLLARFDGAQVALGDVRLG